MLPATSSSAIAASRFPTCDLEPAGADIIDCSRWVIQHLNKLPGIASEATADKVEAHRTALLDCLSRLHSDGRMKSEGEDSVIRPIVVGVQAVTEYALLRQLEKGLIKEIAITFMTKKPPTPLSTAEGALPDSLATPAVLNSAGCIDTVTSRQHLLRKLITHPQVVMTSYYAQKHEASEQGYFDSFCRSNTLQFHAQQVGEIPDALSGATYQVTTNEGHEQWFGIRFTQVNQSSGQCTLFTNIELEGERALLGSWLDAHPLDNVLQGNDGN